MRNPDSPIAHPLLISTLLTFCGCSKINPSVPVAVQPPQKSIELLVTPQQLSATSTVFSVTVRSSGPRPALTLQVRPPDRVKVVSNNAFFTLPASTEPQTQSFRYALRYPQLPVEDALIVLSHATDERVFRIEQRYTFGRTLRTAESIR
jgi:hypothetical protein